MKKQANSHENPDTLKATADLAKRLFRVPKEELQAEEAKYQAEQASKEKKRGPKPKQ